MRAVRCWVAGYATYRCAGCHTCPRVMHAPDMPASVHTCRIVKLTRIHRCDLDILLRGMCQNLSESQKKTTNHLMHTM